MVGLMLVAVLSAAAFSTARAQTSGTVDIVITAGVNDNFALPFEPTSPSADLLLMMDLYGDGDRVLFPHRQFDDKAINRVFGYTFTCLPKDIQAATLEIRMFAGGSSLVSNDSIDLELTGINNASVSWGMGLTALFGQPWTAGSDHTFILDLANLPPDAQGQTNIIPFMNADHALDVYVQDDTAVDYMILTVTVPSGTAVTINHIPPGDPSNAQIITVSASAVNAHLNHGDTLACGGCDAAGPAPGGTIGPPPVPPVPGGAVAPSGTLQLYRGWNNIAWLGQTAAAGQALNSIQGKYRVVYHWQAQSQTWQSYDPTAPTFANTLQNLTNGQAYWIYANEEVALTY